ncbi:MAG: glycosyl hydrolase [Bacteroidota bacterium]|nr:glycosyl hydrolase [Bacteroidota bacterium]
MGAHGGIPTQSRRTVSRAVGTWMGMLFVLTVAPLYSQPVNVRISTPGGYPEETSIAINPTNPDNVIAGANLRYYYWSTDGGLTWGESQLPPATYGDPCVVFGPDGRAYYAHLTVGWDAITVRTSDDGGKTWSAGIKLRGPSSDSARPGPLTNSSLQDKEWLAADITGSRFRGNIYAAWTDFTRYGSANPRDSSVIVFARSTDRGETFEPFVRVSDTAGDAVDSDETMEGAVPAVGPEGEIYLAWAGPAGLYFDRSFDGGVTWGEDMIVSDMPGGWDIDIRGLQRANGLPVTMCDVSRGPYRGTVYVNWVDLRNGDPDVFIARSTDRGATWSAPIRVNDDPLRNGKEQFFTWGTVDPVTGEIVIVFYDRRNYRTDSTDVYLASSTDGGMTFVNRRINEAAFVPSAMVFMGDYNCVSAYGGRIRPIWTRLHGSDLSIHTAVIEGLTHSAVDARIPATATVDAFPNPVTIASDYTTTIRFTAPEAGKTDIAVYDIAGRRIATVFEGWVEGGMTGWTFEAGTLPAGQYVIRAIREGTSGQEARDISSMMTVIK